MVWTAIHGQGCASGSWILRDTEVGSVSILWPPRILVWSLPHRRLWCRCRCLPDCAPARAPTGNPFFPPLLLFPLFLLPLVQLLQHSFQLHTFPVQYNSQLLPIPRFTSNTNHPALLSIFLLRTPLCFLMRREPNKYDSQCTSIFLVNLWLKTSDVSVYAEMPPNLLIRCKR